MRHKDPELMKKISRFVEKFYGSRTPSSKTSVLRKLEKKKDELNTAKQRTSVTKQRKRRVPNL